MAASLFLPLVANPKKLSIASQTTRESQGKRLSARQRSQREKAKAKQRERKEAEARAGKLLSHCRLYHQKRVHASRSNTIFPLSRVRENGTTSWRSESFNYVV